MRLDLYQAETARIAAVQKMVLEEAKALLAQGRPLSLLEQGGVLHALQLLVENSIGKAKQLLKARHLAVPVSAYDAFGALVACGALPQKDLALWNAVLGLRNRIVHDYMNIDLDQVIALIQADKHLFVVDFLCREFDSFA